MRAGLLVAGVACLTGCAAVQHPEAPAPVAMAVCDAPRLDPELVGEIWQDVVEGQALPRLPPSSEACVRELWRPFEPLTICLLSRAGRWWFPMKDVGTLDFELASGRLMVHPPDKELFDVDGYVVTRSFDAIRIRVPGSVGMTPEQYAPDFPEHMIDDRHALVRQGDEQVVFELPTRQVLLSVKPRALTEGESVAGTEVVRDASAPLGARLFGGVLFRRSGGMEAFAVDERGTLLASVKGSMATVQATPEGALVLVAYRAPVVEVTTVTAHAGAVTTSARLPGESGSQPFQLRVSAAKDVVAVGLGTRAILVQPGAAPLVHDARGELLRAEQVRLLAGGAVAVVSASSRTWVLDTRSGRVLVDGLWCEPRFVEGDAGPSAALLTDPTAGPQAQAVVVSADGSVRRGPVGTTRVGRYEVATLAGVVDPGAECAAKVLSALPRMVEFRGWVLPADVLP